MGLFDRFTGKQKELEELLFKVESNIANNYKDAAQEAFIVFEERCAALDGEGRLNAKQKAHYKACTEDLRVRLKGFTHKDQKPYWT
ncbi:MAG: hypothetical protein IJ600_04470 [Lachnospiraceae bacterium]|nr:hypothetical protein [Lachnospiraceae bacterium]